MERRNNMVYLCVCVQLMVLGTGFCALWAQPPGSREAEGLPLGEAAGTAKPSPRGSLGPMGTRVVLGTAQASGAKSSLWPKRAVKVVPVPPSARARGAQRAPRTGPKGPGRVPEGVPPTKPVILI